MNVSITSRTVFACFALILSVLASDVAAAEDAAPKSTTRRVQKPVTDVDGEFADFTQWKEVSEFIERMVSEHSFDRIELEKLFRQTRYVESAIRLMKPAPAGKPKNWHAYRARFIDPIRINAGVRFWNENVDALNRAETQYGVPAEIIVGIIGVETVYGRNTGNFRVMDAITTLAFDYPDTPTRAARMAFFRGELENTLLLARDSHIDPLSLLGSYAGAIGLPQFMPGSIREFAVDFDNDGKVDLRNSAVDAIGSVANYLGKHGWRSGAPIVFATTVSAADGNGARAWDQFIGQGLEAKFTVSELKAAGVDPSVQIPDDVLLGLVDLQNGTAPTEYWLGTANFYAITQYNRSYFYAMSVVDLGHAVRVARDSSDK
jgi:membrane-bound lytic murein transglycosylase B